MNVHQLNIPGLNRTLLYQYYADWLGSIAFDDKDKAKFPDRSVLKQCEEVAIGIMSDKGCFLVESGLHVLAFMLHYVELLHRGIL